jgi:glycosyltransferase involved in cell wall biosynthesis
MPNPVRIPDGPIKKAAIPTVCFLGRWDPQKRVELFFRLASKLPDIQFIAIGKSNFPEIDRELRKKGAGIKNLEMPGFVSEDEKSQILEKSWVLANTSVREGLPFNFLEACAHKTALLSYANPDNFAGQFGYWAAFEDFEGGLKELLRDDLWKERGEAGYKHVCKVHAIDRVTDRLLNMLRLL